MCDDGATLDGEGTDSDGSGHRHAATQAAPPGRARPDQEGPDQGGPDRAGLTRRHLLAAGLAAGGGLLLDELGRPSAAAAAADGTRACSMALHIHSSFSEQYGSMDSQLARAAETGIDVLWWTDHDHRMLQQHYRSRVHFTSLTQEGLDGAPWRWTEVRSGPLAASSTGGIVARPAAPGDPVADGSLHVRADSATGAQASLGFWADSHPAGWNYQANLHGQTLTIDVLLTAAGSGGYLELLLTSSRHEARAGTGAGVYSVSYRFGGPGAPGTRVAHGREGVVQVRAVPGAWSTASLTPTDDIAALWPDLPRDDFASFGLTLSAVSLGGAAEGYFDDLRFTRRYTGGNLPVLAQQQVMRAYAGRYPSVTQHQGLEISGGSPHVGWIGGGVRLGDYSGVVGRTYPDFVRRQVAQIHAGGGVASYNHPFGATDSFVLSQGQQDALVGSVGRALLANRLLGCDLLEVGYYLRGGCDVEHHVLLWDVLSRHGRFVTGVGSSDDHFADTWTDIPNNWFTSVWAPTTSARDLVTALRAGRAWSGSLSRFRGTLDLQADGACPMGSVSVSQAAQRSVRVVATGVPAGGSVRVVRGGADPAGAAARPAAVSTLSGSALRAGSATVTVDTRTSCFVRTQVHDGSGRVVGLSNPVWLLRQPPAGGVPASRRC